MASKGWQIKTIGTLIQEGVILVHKDGNHGSNYPRASEFGTEGVPFLTAKLLDDAGNIDFSSAPRLANEKADKFTFGFIETGDVLLSHNATIGRVAVVPKISERVLIGTSLTQFRLDPGRLLPKYLAAYFSGRDFQNQLAAVMSQTTRNQVPITSQRKLSIVVPPIWEQARIADALGAFDDKIELNRRMNETLEAMARAIFKSWFVDFDPVRAKASGEPPESICRRLGLTPDLLALFPGRLVDSELGEIPEGWEQKRVDDLMELAYGKALKASDRIAGPVPVYGSGGLTGFHNEHLVDGPGIIVGRKGTVGSFYWEDRPFYPIDTVFYVNPKVELTFCYYLLQTLGLDRMNTDAAVPGLNRNNVYRLPIAWVPSGLRSAFDSIAASLRSRIFSNKQESDTLATVRDALLPRLLSAELRVPVEDSV